MRGLLLSITVVTTSILAIGPFLNPALAAEPKAFGLDHRVPWTSSCVAGSPDPSLPYQTERIFPRLKITQPLAFEHEPGTSDYLIIQHLGSWAPPGKILRVPDDPNADRSEVVLELSGIAYGLDFHPDYVRNGQLFVGQNLSVGGTNKTRVSRFDVDRQPPHRIDPKTELVIIEWDSNGHNGGDLAFGNDGMLYVSSGDGTSDSDTNLRGQDMTHLTSKILRIDVDHPDQGRAYSVPKDNPFVDLAGARAETWAYGLRNPWRLSFDRPTGQLWTGVNGQDLKEFAILIEKGKNYGWSINEGSQPFLPQRAMGPTPLTPPTVEHDHSEARSLSGGLVYHGARLPELRGAYIYGDWSTGKIWAVKHDGKRVLWHREIADTPFQITGFGLDARGDLVVIDHQTGFYRLIPTPTTVEPPAAPTFPRRLSDTGLFVDVPGRKQAPGLIPYSVNAPLWSDGAEKERLIAIPGDGKVEFTTGGGGWNFPDGTVLVKTFLLETNQGVPATRRPVETRLLTRQQKEWVGYSYVWNDEGTDAVLVGKEGMDRAFEIRDPMTSEGRRIQNWHYPSRAECMVCHSRAANFVLGLSDVQMNKNHDYGGVVDNQLRALEHIGLFEKPLPKTPETLPKLVDPYDQSAELDARARSYLHANCASCHVEAGGGNAAINLSIGVPLQGMRMLDARSMQETVGPQDLRIVAPGHPERSTLLERVSRRGPRQMPPLGSSVIDDKAVKLLREWITQLAPIPRTPGSNR